MNVPAFVLGVFVFIDNYWIGVYVPYCKIFKGIRTCIVCHYMLNFMLLTVILFSFLSLSHINSHNTMSNETGKQLYNFMVP